MAEIANVTPLALMHCRSNGDSRRTSFAPANSRVKPKDSSGPRSVPVGNRAVPAVQQLRHGRARVATRRARGLRRRRRASGPSRVRIRPTSTASRQSEGRCSIINSRSGTPRRKRHRGVRRLTDRRSGRRLFPELLHGLERHALALRARTSRRTAAARTLEAAVQPVREAVVERGGERRVAVQDVEGPRRRPGSRSTARRPRWPWPCRGWSSGRSPRASPTPPGPRTARSPRCRCRPRPGRRRPT